jgi:SAM-dependent methyltransferase
MIRNSKFFPESAAVHRYLDGLQGVEIGGSAHNAFGVDARNVDYCADMTTVFKLGEIELCGEAMPVDIVASGDELPLDDKSVDFVLSSHVIEHFWDPIKTLFEWRRVARKYIVIICPQRGALPSDISKPLTSLHQLYCRNRGTKVRSPEDDPHGHHSRWTSVTFRRMCEACGFKVIEVLDPDDKVGNGFMVVLDASVVGDFRGTQRLHRLLERGRACLDPRYHLPADWTRRLQVSGGKP